MKWFYMLLLLIPVGGPLFAQLSKTDIAHYLGEASGQLGLDAADTEGFFITSNYTQAATGATHVYLTQTVHGHEIFNAILQLHVGADGKLYTNSRFVVNKSNQTNASEPRLDALSALGKAAEALRLDLKTEPPRIIQQDHPDRVWLVNETLFRNPVRSTLGYERGNGQLVLAYKLIVEPRGSSDMYNIRVDALTGKIIRIDNRTLHCENPLIPPMATGVGMAVPKANDCEVPEKTEAKASYRAYPLGTESPLHGNAALLSGVENHKASPFGWHDVDGAAGEEYTITRGNNVYAYEDQQDNNIPGYSPNAGASLAFDYPADFNLPPQQNMDAALTNLFVWNNFMHDVMYHYGFDEVSGNFQANNYGKGGAGNDYVQAQGFDGGGINNANFGTPEDGFNPTMQMYLWHSAIGKLFIVNSPPSIGGSYVTGGALFGMSPPPTPYTADLVLMAGSAPTPLHGCGTLTNADALQGKIAVADRGGCPYIEKARNAEKAGAIALVVINNQPGGPMRMEGEDYGSMGIICISLSQADGAPIKTLLRNGVTVNASVDGFGTTEGVVFDSNFDNGIISHEYGHGVSNRLTGGPQNVDCLINGQAPGEGWSDFLALAMTDASGSFADQERDLANYVQRSSVPFNPSRPYPYTHDMDVNPSTYGDILLDNEGHSVGSVWCSMLWDLYWDMVAVYGHSHNLYGKMGGNNKAIRLVMEGMRLQPCEPGFVDARDAILQADQMLYGGGNQCIIWKAFARRGLGFSATQSYNGVGYTTEAFDLPQDCKVDGNTPLPESGEILLYPNPTENMLTISTSESILNIRITDVTGKNIRVLPVNGTPVYTLDISDLAAGTYLFRVQTASRTWVRKVLKQQ